MFAQVIKGQRRWRKRKFSYFNTDFKTWVVLKDFFQRCLVCLREITEMLYLNELGERQEKLSPYMNTYVLIVINHVKGTVA